MSDLRWLIVSHLAEAAQEMTMPDDRQRKFRDTRPLALLDGECFVLTHGGKIYVDNHLTSANGASQRDKSPITPRRASTRSDQNGRQARGRPRRETDYTLDPNNGDVLAVTQVGKNGDPNLVTHQLAIQRPGPNDADDSAVARDGRSRAGLEIPA